MLPQYVARQRRAPRVRFPRSCEPRSWVLRGELVGALGLCEGRMTTSWAGTASTHWAIAGIELLPWTSRPWPELFLAPSR